MISNKSRFFIAWVAGTALAVVITLLLWSYINNDNLVAGCERNAERAALDAAVSLDLAAARRARGENVLAAKSDGYAAGLIATIVRPEGFNGNENDLVQVEWVGPRHDGKYRITSHAAQLQHEGCKEAFPPPFDFIK